jgi:hypothetical protein
MLRSIWILSLGAALLTAASARAETFNLSCDDGGMLLTIDTDRATVTDKNPFQQTMVTAPLTVTTETYAWHEGSRDGGADYRIDRATQFVRATADGKAVQLSNPKCGRSAILRQTP